MSRYKREKINLPTYLVPALQRLADKKRWDIDLVVEEALIHYLHQEHVRVPYTRVMKKNTVPAARIAKSAAPKVKKIAGAVKQNLKTNTAKIKSNVSASAKDLKGAVATNRKNNNGKFRPATLKGTY